MTSRILVANRAEVARRIFRTCRDLGIATVAVYSDADAGQPHITEADLAVRLPGAAPADTYLRTDLLVDAAKRTGADAMHPGYGFLSENADFARADLDDLPTALADAAAEAGSALGNPTVFCERYLTAGHHIEVQLLADQHGTVWAVGERECSIQRRHQKIIEESPSPLVDRRPGMLAQLAAAALAAARAVSYAGAGTVEFLADGDGRFFFLEMNTRLQVEHPVTECTTGLDLVALQIAVGEGAALPAEPPPSSGSAVEVRLYAEDPAAGWAPRSGVVRRLSIPAANSPFATGSGQQALRLDAAVAAGTPVGVDDDPLRAKLIAWAPDRRGAARLLAAALRAAEVHGVTTNRDLLVRVLEHLAFLAGDTPTSFLEAHGFPALTAPLVDADSERRAALAAALALDAADRAGAGALSAIPSGWRNVVSAPQLRELAGPSGRHRVAYRLPRHQLDAPDHPDVTLISSSPDEVVLVRDGVRERYRVGHYDTSVNVDGPAGGVRFDVVPRFPEPAEAVPPGSLVAPLPGTVTEVQVADGEHVIAGRAVITVEAMKMQHTLTAPVTGTVREVKARPGQQVKVGTVLAVIAPDPEEQL